MGLASAEQTAQRWYSNKITLMAVTFPIYVADGWSARINVRRHPQPRDGLVFKLIHIGDTLNLIDPDTLPHRLDAADMVGPQVKVGGRSFR